VLQIEAIPGLYFFLELVEKDLLYEQGEVVVDVWFCVGIVDQVLDGGPWAVELVFEIIIADGVSVEMADHQVSLGGCEQFPVGAAFEFGVDGAFPGSGVPGDETLDPLSEPQLVDEIDVEPVTEVFFHRLVAGEVCLCLDGSICGVDADGFPFVPFALVPVDFSHCGGGDVVYDEALDSGCWGFYGVVVDIVGAEAAVTRQEGGLGEEGSLGDLCGLSGETQAADGLKYPAVTQ